ncbi:flagellar export protein FliJ [Chromobacterium sp. ATCC 53434]|uniref:flagellar export protein FliJ n=1 Tax=Chromobacterium TaxID=535 RepID=UPI000C75D156|nr:flagellar export protein FliJ [Chromobacterium sp. ATCC 53434]AUH50487.1 flagellar export protein FliJ [Chromobacterium sp. ATCC 53434]
MNQPLRQLDLLLGLRRRDGEKLEAELAAKRRLQDRYRRNIERLDQLSAASGASAAAGHPALALNCAGYKSHLAGLRQSQQQDLRLAEADAEVSRQRLQAAQRREEQVKLLRDEAAEQWRLLQARGEQKGSDEAAGQAWLRGGGRW